MMAKSATKTSAALVPTLGAWVALNGEPSKLGAVAAVDVDSSPVPRLLVWWFKTQSKDWVPVNEISCGFKLGMDVQESPFYSVRESLGVGQIVEIRDLGGWRQLLVEFYENGTKQWLPWQNFRHAKGPKHLFLAGKFGEKGQAERFRLRNLAYALELWNENTGALSRLEIDPLPHQVNLVHHIIASGNLNWMIADDVGLGKTIEVGMLLAALRQRGLARRVLIVSPAGLTKQWQEELKFKFQMPEFEVYGIDFLVNDQAHWKLHDSVISSVDLIKREDHLPRLLGAENWDLVVFDEAHRLTRRQYGLELKSSERYELAAALRRRSNSFLLLTATPHQGMQDKFVALLELLRPELRKKLRALEMNPHLLREMIFRNNKSEVTDFEGNLIFKGKVTRSLRVEPSPGARDFDSALESYFRKGYKSGEDLSGPRGRAIGFVMTIYRKLAASSVVAIEEALKRRVSRLEASIPQHEVELLEPTADDDRFFGEAEEKESGPSSEFFSGEHEELAALLKMASELRAIDKKMETFLQGLLPSVLENRSDEHVLIFTEYRATQRYIVDCLTSIYGDGKVHVVHGGMDYRERAEAIRLFEEDGQFLVSTEAGGEGINLHRRCNVMVNFDLPWNPMRLVQRIGRLYRYGQNNRVIVFNLETGDSIDSKIVAHMYHRIEQVVKDLATVGSEFNESLADEILGQVAELVDVEGLLESAPVLGLGRAQAEIEAALRIAKDAARKQQELFDYVATYNPSELEYSLPISKEHLRSFVDGMFEELKIEVLQRLHGGKVWEIRIPEHLLDEIPGIRQRLRVTVDRLMVGLRSECHMLDFVSPLFKYLVLTARSYEFGGACASILNISGDGLITAILRWQDDRGRRVRQEFAAALLHKREAMLNPRDLSLWLLENADDGDNSALRAEAEELLAVARDCFNDRLREASTASLYPESCQLISCALVG